MKIGVPTEVKTAEYRIGLRPVGAEVLTKQGHQVFIQAGAGEGSGLTDQEYIDAGATILPDADTLWAEADMIIKVKEPQPIEYPRMRTGQVLFTYFHFAADKDLTIACLEREIVAIAYETLEQPGWLGKPTLPLLSPMSEIAGRMATQEGAKYLERPQGGRGVLLGGVPGVPTGKVAILGGGIVGTNAATIAHGMGAQVIILDLDIERMRYLSATMPREIMTVYSDPEAIRRYTSWADVVIGAVLLPGAEAPKLVTPEHLKNMRDGSIIVDVAIDQGGCAETSRVTTHTDPTYEVEGVLHYCVGNMPGAVALTSTWALTNATLPWASRIANEGYEAVAAADPGFAMAINMDKGKLLNEPVAKAHSLDLQPAG